MDLSHVLPTYVNHECNFIEEMLLWIPLTLQSSPTPPPPQPQLRRAIASFSQCNNQFINAIWRKLLLFHLFVIVVSIAFDLRPILIVDQDPC